MSSEPRSDETDRDEKGRFMPGNKGGPGNPYARKLAHFKRVVQATVTDDDMVEATKMLIANARKGETAAIRLLFQYVAGKPITGPDPDRVDLDELAIAADSPHAVSAATEAMRQMPPEYLCEILRASWPLMGAAMAAQMKEAMETGKPPQPDTSNMTADELLDLGPELDPDEYDDEEDDQPGRKETGQTVNPDRNPTGQTARPSGNQTGQTADPGRQETGQTGGKDPWDEWLYGDGRSTNGSNGRPKGPNDQRRPR